MDQGFHNHLLHTGTLDRYMVVKVFSQVKTPLTAVARWPLQCTERHV